MKNNRFFKISTLLLSCLLLIGAAVGITVSANATASAEIEYINLKYDSAPQLVYYVDAQNVAEGETVKVLLYDSEPAEITLDGAVAVDSIGTLTVGENSYAAYLSEEIAPKNLKLSVWAAPVILDADGEIVYAGDAVSYSVFEYMMKRFDRNPTEDQIALYTSLLNFGGAVQAVLHEQGTYTDEDLALAGGYANYYCGIKLNTVVDGVLLEEGDVIYYPEDATVAFDEDYNLGNSVFEQIVLGETLVSRGCPTVDITTSKPGVTIYSAEYITTGSHFITYDYNTTAANLITTTGTTPSEEIIKNATYTYGGVTYTIGYTKDGLATLSDGKFLHSRHSRIISITDTEGNSYDKTPDDKYIVGKKLSNSNNTAMAEIYGGNDFKQGSAFYFKPQSGDQSAYKTVKRHVFQTDFYLPVCNSTPQGWFIAKTSNISEHKVWGFNVEYFEGAVRVKVQGNSNATACPDHGKVIASGLDKNEWHTLRFEYYDLEGDTMAVYAYVDGEFCGVYTHYWDEVVDKYIQANKEDKYMTSFLMNFTYGTTDVDMYYDNTYFTTEYVEGIGGGAGTGLYANDDNTLDFDYTDKLAAIDKTWDDIYKQNSEFLGFNKAGAFGSAVTHYQYQHVAEENGNYYLKNVVQGLTSPTADPTNKNNYPSISTSRYLAEAEKGDRLVVEMDIRYHGLGVENTSAGDSPTNTAFFRVYSANAIPDGQKNMDCAVMLSLSAVDAGTYWTLGGVNLPKGEWVNIRLVMTPNASDAKKVNYDLYVDNVLVLENKSYTIGTQATHATNDAIGGVIFQMRNRNSHFAYDIDNLFIGAVDAAE